MSKPHSSLSIEALRGIAAICVCFSHFGPSGGNSNQLWLVGRYGVIVFFVISCYVIPLSLPRVGYQLRDCGRFVLKRIVRLYPLFLSVIVVIFLLMAIKLAIGKLTEPYPSGSKLIANLVLAPTVFGQNYLVPIFWALTVEREYYLFIAFTYPLLVTHHVFWRWVVLGTMQLGNHLTLPHIAMLDWLPCFAVGISFWLRKGALLTWPCTVTVVAGALVSYANCEGGLPTLSPMLFLGVLFIPLQGARVRQAAIFLGAISYPLYLLHIPVGAEIGVRVWHWMGHSRESQWTWAGLILLATIGTAWLACLLVDRHAIRWSSRLSLKPPSGHPESTQWMP